LMIDKLGPTGPAALQPESCSQAARFVCHFCLAMIMSLILL